MWCQQGDSNSLRGQPTSSLTTKAGRRATSVIYVFQALMQRYQDEGVWSHLLLAAADGGEGFVSVQAGQSYMSWRRPEMFPSLQFAATALLEGCGSTPSGSEDSVQLPVQRQPGIGSIPIARSFQKVLPLKAAGACSPPHWTAVPGPEKVKSEES